MSINLHNKITAKGIRVMGYSIPISMFPHILLLKVFNKRHQKMIYCLSLDDKFTQDRH